MNTQNRNLKSSSEYEGKPKSKILLGLFSCKKCKNKKPQVSMKEETNLAEPSCILIGQNGLIKKGVCSNQQFKESPDSTKGKVKASSSWETSNFNMNSQNNFDLLVSENQIENVNSLKDNKLPSAEIKNEASENNYQDNLSKEDRESLKQINVLPKVSDAALKSSDHLNQSQNGVIEVQNETVITITEIEKNQEEMKTSEGNIDGKEEMNQLVKSENIINNDKNDNKMKEEQINNDLNNKNLLTNDKLCIKNSKLEIVKDIITKLKKDISFVMTFDDDYSACNLNIFGNIDKLENQLKNLILLKQSMDSCTLFVDILSKKQKELLVLLECLREDVFQAYLKLDPDEKYSVARQGGQMGCIFTLLGVLEREIQGTMKEIKRFCLDKDHLGNTKAKKCSNKKITKSLPSFNFSYNDTNDATENNSPLTSSMVAKLLQPSEPDSSDPPQGTKEEIYQGIKGIGELSKFLKDLFYNKKEIFKEYNNEIVQNQLKNNEIWCSDLQQKIPTDEEIRYNFKYLELKEESEESFVSFDSGISPASTQYSSVKSEEQKISVKNNSDLTDITESMSTTEYSSKPLNMPTDTAIIENLFTDYFEEKNTMDNSKGRKFLLDKHSKESVVLNWLRECENQNQQTSETFYHYTKDKTKEKIKYVKYLRRGQKIFNILTEDNCTQAYSDNFKNSACKNFFSINENSIPPVWNDFVIESVYSLEQYDWPHTKMENIK